MQNKFLVVALFLVVFLIFFKLSVPEYSGDVKNHLAWAQSMLELGPRGFFERDFPGYAFPNYPPLMMGLFTVSLWFYQTINQVSYSVNNLIPIFPSNLVFFFQNDNVRISFLKLPAILANFLTGYALYLLLKQAKIKKAYLVFPLVLLNPAIFYLSVIWGQVDVLPLAFFLLAVYFIKAKRLLISTLMIVLALLSKQTIVIFLPVYLYLLWRNNGVATTLRHISLIVIFCLISYIPFYSLDLLKPFSLYQKNFDLVAHTVNENAFNFWGAIFDFKRVSDKEPSFYGLNYQRGGYLLFALLMFVPSLKFLKKEKNLETILSFLFLITVTFFFVLTRMHERYLVPALIYLSGLVVLNKRYLWGLIFFTTIHFFNLYNGLYMPFNKLLIDLLSFDWLMNLMIMIYGVTILIYIYYFVRDSKK